MTNPSSQVGSATPSSLVSRRGKERNLGALSSYKIKLLKDTNWHAWKLRIEKILRLH